MSWESETQQAPEPPQPPSFTRKFKLYPYQYIAIPLLLLIPALALFGVLSEQVVEANGSSADLQVRVHYPTQSHYRLQHQIEVAVTNTSGEALPALTVSIDTELLNAFTDLSFSREPEQITNEAYEIPLENIAPGETQLLIVDVRAQRYWQYNGSISVTGQDVDPVSIPLNVFIFP